MALCLATIIKLIEVVCCNENTENCELLSNLGLLPSENNLMFTKVLDSLSFAQSSDDQRPIAEFSSIGKFQEWRVSTIQKIEQIFPPIYK